MVITTNPNEATRGPNQLIALWDSRYPGEIATAPNVPSLVEVG